MTDLLTILLDVAAGHLSPSSMCGCAGPRDGPDPAWCPFQHEELRRQIWNRLRRAPPQGAVELGRLLGEAERMARRIRQQAREVPPDAFRHGLGGWSAAPVLASSES